MSISEDLARTGSGAGFTEMFTDFPPGSSKQVSQQIRSNSAVIPSGLSKHFQVDGDKQKVDGTGCQRHPHRQGIWGWHRPQRGTGAEPRWGSRGRSPQEQNEFGVFTQVLKLPFLRAINSNSLFF